MRGETLARLFVIVGGLIVLALTAALVGPYFIDWTSYRADFEREASRILGRKVTVEGTATARLLPFPSVRFTDVRVEGNAPGETAMTADSFSMDAELAPFLSGEILIFDMRLERPEAVIEIGPQGRIDWALRPTTRFDPHQITLENVTVTDGAISIRHGVSGRAHEVSALNARISARSLAGPWRMEGEARLDGMPARLAISTGTPDDNGSMRLRVRAASVVYPIELEADGDVRVDAGAARYSGTFQVGMGFSQQPDHGPQPAAGSTVADRTGIADHRVSGRFSLDHRRLDVAEFRFETGARDDPYTADGTALLDFGRDPRFLVEARGSQVRLDGEAGQDAQGEAGLPLAERLGAVRRLLEDLPRPAIDGRVEIELPAIVAGDTTIRNIEVSAEPARSGWVIDNFGASFPGRTTLEASGLLSVEEDVGFRGEMLVAVGQPSGFAAWLAKDVDEAIRRLPSAGFSADVDLGPQRQRFTDMELILGKSRFTGALDRLSRPDVRPSMLAHLDGGALDLEGMTAFASLFVADDGEARFGGHDIEFELKAGPVEAAQMRAESVDAALRLKEDRLEIDRLAIGGLAGANVSATGTVTDLSGEPAGNVDVSVVSPDLVPFVRLVAERYPDNAIAQAAARRADIFPGLYADARIDLVGSLARRSGGATDIALSVQGKAGESYYTMAASADAVAGDLATAPLKIDFSARGANGAALLALSGLPALDLGLADGGEAELKLDGVLSDGASARFVLSGEDASAVYDGEVRAMPQGLSGKGRLELKGDDFEPWLMSVGAGVPGMGLGLPADMTMTADFEPGALHFDDIQGTIASIPVSGDLDVETGEEVPHVTGEASLDVLDLSLAGMMILGERAFESDGEDWPDMPYRQTGHAPITGDISLKVASLDFGSAAAADDVEMRMRINRDGLRLSDVSGSIFGGRAEALIELQNNEGTGLFSGHVNISHADARTLLPAAALDGKVDLTAELTSNGKSTGALIASLSGSGTARVDGLVVPGLNGEAFPSIIAEADRIGRDIDAEKTAAFAPTILRDGRFRMPPSEVAFTVAAGVVRTPPLFIEGDGAGIETELRLDLNATRVSADGQIVFDAGDEALVGSEPRVGFTVSGPLKYPHASLDTVPLGQFLTQRALEIEQARVEAMQARLLEKQRLRREARYYERRADTRREAADRARRSAEDDVRRMLRREDERQAEERRRQEELSRQRPENAGAAGGEEGPDAQPTVEEPPPGLFDATSIRDLLNSLQGDAIR
ncbi:AsmA family protein [Mesorhizobium xinjiangense]|uniref:AsmA family protein n=1 Tax=Mesorhizobium xinjiangense TaxID=2678685 RepID=UPI0012EE5C70|nr:AsmA family protein [Mesorhizobium xinjiangense]